MMFGVEGQISGVTKTLITNGGNHTPESWATMTVDCLFEADPAISDNRAGAYRELRSKTRALLLEAFRAVRSDASEAVLWRDACAVHGVMLRYARSTPWDTEFENAAVAMIMKDVIYRNLRTAADLAVRWE